MKKPTYLKSVLTVVLVLCAMLSYAQNNFGTHVPFKPRFDQTLKGDILLIGNNILNRDGKGKEGPNTAYDGTEMNANLSMAYIDIDNDDSTFSSSSADLTVPTDCYNIIYAGLYWSGIYFEDDRSTLNKIKFKTPEGSSYEDITGELIYDAVDTPIQGVSKSFACYADVTGLVQGLSDPEGTYTAANILASTGNADWESVGTSAGWSLFIVYEDPLLPGKAIVSFDGFSAIGRDYVLDVPIEGFKTIPVGPVRAKYAFACLEGDYGFSGDYLAINGAKLSADGRPNDNFFNSSVTTVSGNDIRNPNSSNTLGYDAGILEIDNPDNKIIANNDTSATITLGTQTDVFHFYFNAFAVEIIQPDITLTKIVEDGAGNNINDGDVTLGQELEYVLKFQNTGNDDATNYSIKDVLPINVNFLSMNLDGAPGVTYTYNENDHSLNFQIPDDLVEEKDPVYEIRIKVKVIEECYKLRDACSNIIKNQAFSTYYSETSGNVVGNENPSVSGIGNCGLTTPGSTNFLVDIDGCTFEREEVLCSNSMVLTAGDGYKAYQWYKGTPSNGTPIGNSQSVTVTEPGVYTSVNTTDRPCISITETVNVVLFGADLPNPILPYADKVLTCPDDNSKLPVIFLCGTGDSQLLESNITDAESIVWEKLNEGSCSDVNTNCANKNSSCSWSQVGTEANYTANEAGEFRLRIIYQDGCFVTFYFNVHKNLFTPTETHTDISCDTDGNITVKGVPAGYEYSINGVDGPYQDSNSFNIATAGNYTVHIRPKGIDTETCVFILDNIPVRSRDFTVDVITKQPLCATDKGSVRIQINDVDPQFTYKIEKGNTVLDEVGPIDDNDYEFNNLNAGDYTVSVTTANGCTYTENVSITKPDPITVSAALTAPVGCDNGEVTITTAGGTPPYYYYINDAADYQTSNTFNVDAPGTYTIQIIDFNNCKAETEIVVTKAEAPSYTIQTTDNNCSATNEGSITVNVDNTNGYTLEYSIDGGTTFQTSNVFSNLSSGNYDVLINYSLKGATCTLQDTAEIMGSASISGEAVLIQEYNCNQSASIQAQNVTGGQTPYEYSLDGSTFQNSDTFTGLNAGTYMITIRDANGCTFKTNKIVIDAVNAPQGVTFNSTEVSCDNPASTITLNVDGNGTFQYEITAPISVDNGSNNIFADLSPGTYTFLITNDKGCSLTDSYTIKSISPVTVEGTVIGDVNCVGTATGEVSFTINGFETTYAYSINGGATTTGETQNTLTFNYGAGTYTIEVTDESTNCKATASVTVSEAANPLTDANPDVTPMSCSTDGSVTLNATGGTGAKTYTLTLPDGSTVGPQANATFNGLNASGEHQYTIEDVAGCAVTGSFDLKSTTAPVATLHASSDLCFDNTTNATLVVSVTGGKSPYTYSLNGGAFQTNNTFTNITPGDYTVDVLDANGCPATTINQTIAPQLVIDAVLVKNLDCSTSPDAEIKVSLSGGEQDYNYQVALDGGSYSSKTAFTGTEFIYNATTDGAYTFLVTDANGCTVESSKVIVSPLPVLNAPNVTITQDILCHGDDSGAVTIEPTGGLPPYTISIENSFGKDLGEQTSGLNAGNYTVTITDANGCTVNESFTIAEPDGITFEIETKDITCEGFDDETGTPKASTGQIIVKNVSGGTPGYTYYVTNNFGFADSYVPVSGEDYTFIVIDYGIYQVNVVDANGCSVLKENIIIASPPGELSVDVSTTTDDCTTGGTAIVAVESLVASNNYEFGILETNTPPYTTNYFDPDPSTPLTYTFTGLTPGVLYTFVVHDKTTDCYSIKTADMPIDSQSNLTASIDESNNITCTGSDNGNVSFTFGNYAATTTEVSYEIFKAHSNTSTGYTGTESGLTGADVTVSNLGSLEPGEYYILLKEVGGCSIASESFNITESAQPLEVSATITKNDNCYDKAGVITAQAQYGTAPYKYIFLPAGSTTPDASAAWVDTKVFHADGGDYDVYAMDVFECIKQTSATITLPTDTAPTLTLAVDSATICGDEGNFTLVVTRDSDGVAPFTYSINGSAFKTMTEDSTNSFELTNLNSGEHTIVLKDANGCTSEQKITIYPPLNGTATANISATPDCNVSDGSITVNAVGGSGNYNYDISPAVGNLSGDTFSNLPAGSYTVTITDAETNCIKTIDIEIPAGTPVTFDIDNVQVEHANCNGGNDGSITVRLPNNQINLPYTYTLTGTAPVVAAQSNTTGIFEGLTAGDYDIQVTSARNCENSISVTITEPGILSTTATATAFACNTNNTTNTATITIEANGGTTPYYYSVNGADYFETNTFKVVDNGTTQNIQTYVKDANGCEVTASVTIEPLPSMDEIQIDLVEEITCENGEKIILTINDNPTEYTYQLLPSGTPQSSNEFILNEPGTYTFMMTNNETGCYAISDPYTVEPFNTIETEIVATTGVKCYGDFSGSVTINISGYAGSYTYGVRDTDGNELSPAIGGSINPFQDTLVINNLPAGNFYVEITESEKPFCSIDTAVFNISSPDAGIALDLETTSVTCTNDLGTITALGTGGTGALQYEFTTGTGSILQAASSDNSLEGLGAGTYIVTVTDASGCELISEPITLVAPTPIDASISVAPSDLSCIGDANAIITVDNVTGGQGNGYLYALVNTATGTESGPQPSNVFSNIAAGTYYVIVSDGWNCEFITANITVTEPTNAIEGTLTLNASATCNTNASITLSASGGTAPYQYSTDGTNFSPLTNPSTFNVQAGAYQYYIKDANNCDIVLTNKVEVEPVNPIDIDLDLSGAVVSCAGGNNATIRVKAKHGLGNYTYKLYQAGNTAPIAGPQTNGVFEGLGAGMYNVEVQSGSDCTYMSTEIFIDDPNPLNISFTKTDVTCNGETDGTITITAQGGTGTIQYAISPDFKQFVNDNTFKDLAAGTYEVYVQDQSGCFQIIEVTINEPAKLDAEISAVNGEQCLGDANGSLTVKINGGTAPFSVRLDGNGTVISNFTEIEGNEYTFTGLSGDTFYQVYVNDVNNCTIALPLEQYMDPAVEVIPTVTIENVCTNNGPQSNITIDVNDEVKGSVQFSIDGTTYVSTNTFTNLSVGTHTAYVLHNNGCLKTVDFEILPLNPITAEADTVVKTDVLCYGETNGEISINATGGTGNLQYGISPDFNLQSSNTFSGLTAGIYDVKVVDEIGCEVILNNIVINEPTSALTATANTTSEVCYQANDGTITVDILGGTAPYQVKLNDGTFEAVTGTQHIFSALAGATEYTVYVKDANDCEIAPVAVTIESGVIIDPVATVEDTCTNNTIGNNVTVTVNDAIANEVQYSIDGVDYSNSNVFTNLDPGTYTLYAKHNNGCIQTTTVTIEDLTPITATANVSSQVLCFGAATGEIEVTASGGSGNYQYAISPDFNYVSSATFTNLAAGNYTIKVLDAELGCEEEVTSIIISEPASAITATASATSEICYQANDGTITVDISGGVSPYEIKLNDGSYVTVSGNQHTFTMLEGATEYTIYVKDANACEITPIPITVHSGAILEPTIAIENTCNNNTIGNMVTITMNNEEKDAVQFSLDGNTYQTSNVYNNLDAGTYTVYIKHNDGCLKETTFTIDDLTPINATAEITSEVLCYGEESGEIHVTATGGSGNYQYAISPDFNYVATSTFSALTAGTYIIKVFDTTIGCEMELTGQVISEPASQLTATVTPSNEVCFEAEDGTITVNISGGTSPYQVSLNNGTFETVTGSEYVFTNLEGGTDYSILVKDANGCDITPLNTTIGSGINFEPTAAIEYNCTANATGNTVTVTVDETVEADVTYALNGGSYSSTNVFTNLAVGTHTISVKHTNGCIQTVEAVIDATTPISADVNHTEPLCSGDASGTITISNVVGGQGDTYMYAISPNFEPTSEHTFTDLAAGTYTLRVYDALGCYFETTETVSEPTPLQANVKQVFEEYCGNDDNGAIEIEIIKNSGTPPYYTSLEPDANFVEGQLLFDQLDGGKTYTIYVKDANGCLTSVQATLAAPVNIVPMVETVYSCEQNITEIVLDASVASESSFFINGEASKTGGKFMNLSSGTYDVEVVHISGCTATVSFKVDNALPLNLEVKESNINEVEATVTGGTGNYTYTFNGENYGSNNVYEIEESGTLHVIATDELGCQREAVLDVTKLDIEIDNFFTPDGNGENDEWGPINAFVYPNITTKIYDRYGRVVSTLRVSEKWDGTYNGNALPTGDYWYIINLNDSENDKDYVGHFTLYR